MRLVLPASAPTSDTLRHRSLEWVMSLRPRHVALQTALATLAVGGLDLWINRALGQDFLATAVYLAPITLAGFAVGGGYAAALSALAMLLELGVSWFGSPHRPGEALSVVMAGILDFPIFAGAAVTVAALRRLLEAERLHARSDALTGIGNRRALREAAEVELIRARRTRTPLSVLYLDVDGFKQINDSLGHARGDELLCAVAGAISLAIRGTDTAARLGGDEFAVLLPGAGYEECTAVAQRFRTVLTEAAASAGLPATFSIGGATFMTPPSSADALLTGADEAMYRVKREIGRASCRERVYHPV